MELTEKSNAWELHRDTHVNLFIKDIDKNGNISIRKRDGILIDIDSTHLHLKSIDDGKVRSFLRAEIKRVEPWNGQHD